MVFNRIKIQPEQSECIVLADWLSIHPLLKDDYFHIPNEGKRSRIVGWILRRMGLKKGVSDYFIAHPRKEYHGLFIEMKAKNSQGYYTKPTREQLEFLDKRRIKGYAAHCCNGADDAITVIKDYLV